MKIEQVTIKGFQSHVDSTFQLSPGLTVITGPSDAGKTAIVRALRWLAFNEPQGEAFLHTIRNPDGSVKEAVDQASVEVTFDTGITISKTRRKGKTTWTHSLYPEPWEKAEVPPEIKETLGLMKQEYGDFTTCLNFAFQLDAPFLLSETASVGAKVLGKIAGTEIVDKSIGEVNKKTHKARTDAAAAEKRIGQLDVELLEYLTLDDTKASYDKAAKLYEAMLKDKGTLEDIKDLLSIYWKKSAELVAAWDNLDPLRFVGLMKTHLQNVEYDYGKLEAIKVLEGDFWKAVEDSRQASETVHRLKDTEGLVRWLESLDKVVVMATDMDSLNAQYWYQKGQIDKATNAVELHTATAGLLPKLEDLEKKYEQLTALEGVRSVHSMAENGRKAVKARMERLEGLGAVRGKLEAIVDSSERIKELYQLQHDYNGASMYRSRCEQEIQFKDAEAKIAKEDLHRAWEEAGGICPLCGNTLESGCIA